MRFRTPQTQEQLDDFEFRHAVEQGAYVDAGFDDGLGWYRMRQRIGIHPVWMSTVLERVPSVCQALAIPDTTPRYQPPTADEASDCVPLPTEERVYLTSGNFGLLAEYLDTYPWFRDVMNTYSDSAAGFFTYWFYSDGTFERVALCMPTYCGPSPSP